MLEQKRESFKNLEKITGRIFSGLGLSPNQYTILSVIFATLSFFYLTDNNFIGALLSFLLASFLDFIDGAVARITKKASKKGAYVDTICDRYVEGIILLGFLFLTFPSLLLPSEVWIFLAFFGSLMTTYSKAAAKEKGLVEKELKRALFSRAERLILISIVMILGIFNSSLIIYPIIILAIFSNISAFQRIYLALGPGNG